MSFIRDIIYGLKIDMGEPITIYKDTVVEDLETGNKVTTNVYAFRIPKAIIVPIRSTESFFRKLGIHPAGLREIDETLILVDTQDIPSNRTIDFGSYLGYEDRRFEISNVEDFKEAKVIKIKGIIGLTI